MNLFEVSKEISNRLIRIFLRDEQGRRPVYGGTEKFQSDPFWRDNIYSSNISMATMAPGWAPAIRPAGPDSSPNSSSSTVSSTEADPRNR